MALNRRMEIAAKIEATPGTGASGLYAAANAKHLVIDPTLEFDSPLFERQIKRSTLTSIEGLTGIKEGRSSFRLEMSGQAIAVPDIPTWDLFMKACAFRSVATKQVAFTACSGVLRHGEIVTATGTGASGTATVVHDTYPATVGGAGTIYLADDTVVWATTGATTLTGGTSGKTATVAAGVSSSDAGQSWYPITQATVQISGGSITGSLAVGNVLVESDGVNPLQVAGIITKISGTTIWVRQYNGFPTVGSGFKYHKAGQSPGSPTDYYLMTSATVAQDDIPTISIAQNDDGVLKTLIGCKGNWAMEARIGEPALMTFEFSGKPSPVAVTDLGMLTGVVYESKVPPVFLSAALIAGHEGDTSTLLNYSPRASAVSLNLNNEVGLRQDANQPSGIVHAEITGRSASGTFDPEQDLEASFPFIQDFLDGDVWRMKFQVGTVAGNKFLVSVPGLQTTGESTGERTGQSVRTLPFRASGGHLSNASDTPGSDNEVVITYLLV